MHRLDALLEVPADMDIIHVRSTGLGELFNFTVEEHHESSSLPRSAATVFLAIVLGILILTTLIGNTFVVFAIWTDRNLKRIGNYLILSLAVADFLVALTVMPIGAIYEVSGEWSLGPAWCELWTSLDVLCCTASILHLVAIALDRYWTVTNIDYVHKRSGRCIIKMLVGVWSVAATVSLAPLFGWKDDKFDERISSDKTCLVSQDVSYQVFATCSTFYAPLVVILMLYWSVFKVARKRIRHKPGKTVQLTEVKRDKKTRKADKKTMASATAKSSSNETEMITKNLSSESNKDINSGDGRSSVDSAQAIGADTRGQTTSNTLKVDTASYREIVEQDSIESARTLATMSNNGSAATAIRAGTLRESLDAKRERKAAKTLAIITGVFVICWLPFFVIALLMPLCGESCELPKAVFSFFLWLGYINSMLNPIIYTIFSPDFRAAFQRILLGKKTPTRSPCRV